MKISTDNTCQGNLPYPSPDRATLHKCQPDGFKTPTNSGARFIAFSYQQSITLRTF